MRYTREYLEELEANALASYAIKSRDSRGRVHAQSKADYRTDFQRDRDRILHTTAFRRLEYKTQVFVNHEGDYYRTRLTHTLEVTQIGRTLARALGANEDLVESICLSHDLGHPPFGHSGEAVLDKLMSEHGGFEHNKQSYRIVTKLEKRYRDWNGLNLTYETREGIVKHETEYDRSDDTEFSPELRASLEAQIANIADELAYNAHDLDDGLRSGLLHVSQLDSLDLWREIKDLSDWPGGDLAEIDRHHLIRKVISVQMNDVIANTVANLEQYNPQSSADVQSLDINLVAYSNTMQPKLRAWKQFLFENMYRHYRVVRMSQKAERFLTDIFREFVREPAQLPDSTRAKIDSVGLHRCVTDYIAGMTDRYALQEWEKLFGPFVRT